MARRSKKEKQEKCEHKLQQVLKKKAVKEQICLLCKKVLHRW